MAKLRAVIFDRVEAVRDMIAVALRDRGYEILSFPEPGICPVYREDLSLCPREQACSDLLITDNQLPKMSGLDFIERQRARGCKGAVRNMAVMAAHWAPQDLERARRLGCKVLKKPFRFRDITAWLDSLKNATDPDRQAAALEELRQ